MSLSEVVLELLISAFTKYREGEQDKALELLEEASRKQRFIERRRLKSSRRSLEK